MRVSTAQFFFDKPTNTFVGEASELPAFGAMITLVSHVTGKAVDYSCVGAEQDSEGEVTCWNFIEDPNQRNYGTRIRVYND